MGSRPYADWYSKRRTVSGTCYKTWPDFAESPRVLISACENKAGRSGYLKFENVTTADLNICWEVTYANGKTSKGCKSTLEAGETTTSSCYSCNRGHTGATSLKFTKVESK